VHTTNHLTASTTNADLGDGLLGLNDSNQHANLQPGGPTRTDWPVWVADLCSKRLQPADVMGKIYIYVGKCGNTVGWVIMRAIAEQHAWGQTVQQCTQHSAGNQPVQQETMQTAC